MAEDIISTLPDAIICHILSFLETKQAVAASVLSKRWKNLWLSVPTLCFTNTVRDHLTNFQFKDFVYSVLLPRDATFPIKRFHFEVTYDDPIRCPIDSITKWVNFVVQRKIEYLYLHPNAMGLPKLPVTILTCKTLVVLKLLSFSVEEGFNSVVLPSLKTLHLEFIWFPKLRDFMMFLTGCPNLEDLFTYDVAFDSEEESLTCDEWKSFCLCNLTTADIDCARCYFPLKAIHNVHSLSLEIEQVHYNNNPIPTFHNLTKLELISLEYSWQFLVKVLNHCPKLEELNIDQADVNKEYWTREDDKENWVDPDVVPQCLSLHLRTCNLINFLGLQG
ncbi:hypothetical protein TSUD_164060 [Trifolium subterraneum]|uniref:F-box domain-containing protein n=1 Tax=Trifolium subterraneum TaxID=3900 RepID=A0A2Z6MQH4_TRISU|nr:hypothetical protein TSUD_164060 [Trifolium subterraneum]